jgi:hypothetical protein
MGTPDAYSAACYKQYGRNTFQQLLLSLFSKGWSIRAQARTSFDFINNFLFKLIAQASEL